MDQNLSYFSVIVCSSAKSEGSDRLSVLAGGLTGNHMLKNFRHAVDRLEVEHAGEKTVYLPCFRRYLILPSSSSSITHRRNICLCLALRDFCPLLLGNVHLPVCTLTEKDFLLCSDPVDLLSDLVTVELDLGLLSAKGCFWWLSLLLLEGKPVFGELIVGDGLEAPGPIAKFIMSQLGEFFWTEKNLSMLSVGFKDLVGRWVAMFCLVLALTAEIPTWQGFNTDVAVDAPAVGLPELYDLEFLGRSHCGWCRCWFCWLSLYVCDLTWRMNDDSEAEWGESLSLYPSFWVLWTLIFSQWTHVEPLLGTLIYVEGN